MGIIDILIEYGAAKRIEYMSKLMTHCNKRFSCVPPQKYRDRFIEYTSTVIARDNKEIKDVQD